MYETPRVSWKDFSTKKEAREDFSKRNQELIFLKENIEKLELQAYHRKQCKSVGVWMTKDTSMSRKEEIKLLERVLDYSLNGKFKEFFVKEKFDRHFFFNLIPYELEQKIKFEDYSDMIDDFKNFIEELIQTLKDEKRLLKKAMKDFQAIKEIKFNFTEEERISLIKADTRAVLNLKGISNEEAKLATSLDTSAGMALYLEMAMAY